MTPPMKYHEKGIFKSEKRARKLQDKLRNEGKLTRVDTVHLPLYGGAVIYGLCYSLKVKAKKPFMGRSFIIDTKAE